ncbi:hypothetical protein PanWU01x14_193640 [Parasponia andersonii]|uniref:Uncharacterized protein n=1 Tax=Parasponia andersonii TaxID=3476 RepID=A0A2P5C0M9_PARAD|nr:hypothetical protein PanWU01x14_193640 [Parasponia andersonii]
MERQVLEGAAEQLDEMCKLISETMKELRMIKDGGLMELVDDDLLLEQLEALLKTGESFLNYKEDQHKGRWKDMIRNHLFPSEDTSLDRINLSADTEAKLNTLKKMMEKTVRAGFRISQGLNNWIDQSQKYNVPMQNKPKDFEYLMDFMGLWKMEANVGRWIGQRSLVELLRQLDLDGCKQSKASSKQMKVTATVLGIRISLCITEFYLLNAALGKSGKEIAKKVRRFTVILEGLTIEENSIIIKKFVSVLKVFERTLICAGPILERGNAAENFLGIELAQKVHHLILREVLRLEVAFCCPHLPVTLETDVFSAMGKHVTEIFGKELNKISSKIDELKREILLLGEDDQDPTVELIRERLGVVINIIWKWKWT